MTQILSEQELNIAADILREGGTVVFPTETVYGLGANALDEQAAKKIFAAKGRPADNPLIVHIYSLEQMDNLVSEIPQSFAMLAQKFWPGPLTMVLKKSHNIPDVVSAGLDTVGIRMPNHPIALSLIRLADIPIAAPSANISGAPSPTEAKHVINDLNGKVDAIIDGGNCRVGLESTVLDLSGEVPVLLRPGGVTLEQLKEELGTVLVDDHVNTPVSGKIEPKSPGVKYKHYAPKAQVILFEGLIEKMMDAIVKKANELKLQEKTVGILATDQTKGSYSFKYVISLGDRSNSVAIAAKFFSALREFDKLGVDIILAESVDKKGVGMAVMNRMERAAGHNIVRV